MSRKSKKSVDKRKRMIQTVSIALAVIMGIIAIVSSYYMITG